MKNLFINVRLKGNKELQSILINDGKFEKIGKIGWGKMLAWYISLIIIAFALLILATIIAEILPFEIGVYFDMLFIISYIFMAGFHYVGMIYTETESN